MTEKPLRVYKLAVDRVELTPDVIALRDAYGMTTILSPREVLLDEPE